MTDEVFRWIATAGVVLVAAAFVVQAVAAIAVSRGLRQLQGKITGFLANAEPAIARLDPLIERATVLMDTLTPQIEIAGATIEKAGPALERARVTLDKASAAIDRAGRSSIRPGRRWATPTWRSRKIAREFRKSPSRWPGSHAPAGSRWIASAHCWRMPATALARGWRRSITPSPTRWSRWAKWATR
jgi:hypothetical protein